MRIGKGQCRIAPITRIEAIATARIRHHQLTKPRTGQLRAQTRDMHLHPVSFRIVIEPPDIGQQAGAGYAAAGQFGQMPQQREFTRMQAQPAPVDLRIAVKQVEQQGPGRALARHGCGLQQHPLRPLVQFIQPDIARVGGISESLRIAALAESRGVRMIPHCWSTDILVAATLHVISTLRDCPYLEYNATDNPLRTDLLVDPIRPVDGIVTVPEKPGLGIELNQDTIDRYRWNP